MDLSGSCTNWEDIFNTRNYKPTSKGKRNMNRNEKGGNKGGTSSGSVKSESTEDQSSEGGPTSIFITMNVDTECIE